MSLPPYLVTQRYNSGKPPIDSNISEFGSGTEDCAARVRGIVLPRKNVAAVHINANSSWHPR